ncbi:hypothetical protein CLU96_3806 [Chryseobacterium sp. 52]|uniref:hypothetical protein n=1 Tax=Chryseobacterium sp. 52 TaxID=2035213 RepID=UPI000C178BC3|nr:hypothetical protein [Chryseobacterium sp. 52]PIF46766.1 hypothetical protein CLU96_3806 [Chryseobacterium sp. 52]
MKINTLLITLIAFVLFSCKEKKEVVENGVSKIPEIDTVVAAPPQEVKTDTVVIKEPENIQSEETETETETQESPITYDFAFHKFPSKKYTFVKKATLDFSSDEGAYNFRTRIKEAYASGTPDFASYYITVIFGCGSSCIMGLMMDVRDGKIYGLPLGEETSCMFAEDRALFNVKSKLFIASICKESPEAESVYYHAFVWNEEKKMFEKAEEKDIK